MLNLNMATIDVSRIVLDNEIREVYQQDSLDLLGKSILARGQIQPGGVRWDPDRNVYSLIWGHRRYLACKSAGIPLYKALVFDRELTRAEILEYQYIENVHREDMNPIEKAKAMQQLMDLKGFNQVQLAEFLNVAKSTIHSRLSFLKLPEEAQAEIEAKVEPATATLNKHRKKAAEKYRGEKSDGARPQGYRRTEPKRHKFVLRVGGVVVTLKSRQTLTEDKIAETLARAAEQVRLGIVPTAEAAE